MKNFEIRNIVIFSFLLLTVLQGSFIALGQEQTNETYADSVDLKYPIYQDGFTPYDDQEGSNVDLENSRIETVIEYDPVTNQYIIRKKVGDIEYRTPYYMSFDEYQEYDFDQSLQRYWMQRARGEDMRGEDNRLLSDLEVGVKALGTIFGSDVITIRPQGSAEISFGLQSSKVDNPTLPERLRRTTTFDFNEKIQMNVRGSIGDKLKLGVNYNTEATFEFENEMNLEYAGKEDEIIQSIEAGNVSLPLPGSLITGSQSLFGVKTELKFGKLNVSAVFSQQKGETSVINVKGGAQSSEFDIPVDEYDANRHFFLSKYFYDNYNESLKDLPVIRSAIRISKVEVWVTNRSANYENARNLVAFVDIGENTGNIANPALFPGQNATPDNRTNELYSKMTGQYSGIRNISSVTEILSPLAEQDFVSGKDYEKVQNARLLNPNEYTLNPQLGYISLNTSLNNDEVLAVAYEYTVNGEVKRVGEFSTSGITAPDALFLKLLKGTNLSPQLPTWDLMMKNVYAIGAYQVNREDFIMNVVYRNDRTGTDLNYINSPNIEERTLLQVLRLDTLNSQLEPASNGDGVFDFIEGITIRSSTGRIIFPVTQPFGDYLAGQLQLPSEIDKYAYFELYDSTKTVAEQTAEKNKFRLTGTYQSSSGSEITLNALNVPRGSVVVTAGGVKLTENVDYTVDYTLGRVKIINDGLLESGTPISISLESQSLFNLQTKTMMGTHLDYEFSDNFNLGGTILHLSERPLTKKVNYGNDPIANTIWGLNGRYTTESQLLTNWVDKLPFLEASQPSNITIEGEMANLIPGSSGVIKESGTAYIDDFEGTKINLDLKNINAWALASTPQKQEELFPYGNLINDLSNGFNRAHLAWYYIDPLFLRNNTLTPGHIRNNPDEQNNHFVREIFEREIFPNKETPSGVPTNIPVLNMAYYPSERGQYNFDPSLDESGNLINPESRWGGIMREIQTSDFEAANIEYIEFWMMDPFVYDTTGAAGGDLYFNLGNISEDILKDSRKFFENGLPHPPDFDQIDSTEWGYVPKQQSLVNAFNTNPEARENQDVGFDGLKDDQERYFYADYLSQIQGVVNPQKFNEILNDPASDNYHYFRGSDYDNQQVSILERYKKYNGTEGNSPTDEQSPEEYPTSATTLPDAEDINRDNTLSETEDYYQYRVSIRPQDMEIGQNFISDQITSTITYRNGEKDQVTWYQFKIPVRTDNKQKIGNINDFKSIRFMRMFLKGFQDSVILRFATLDLVRGEWRNYDGLVNDDELVGGEMEITAVNIEENGNRQPVNYVLPPGIDRVIDPNNPQLTQLNEQSVSLKATNIPDGTSKAAYKTLNMDLRRYKRLKMEVHAEEIQGEQDLQDGEMVAFIRLGSDYKNNYYEYEVPLKLTPPGNYNSSAGDREIVWPRDNQFDILLDNLPDLKLKRNEIVRSAGSTLTYLDEYSEPDPNNPENRIKVRGNPSISLVKTIMIGIRNVDDNGGNESVEVWMNELRLSEFDQEGGWAATGRMTTKLSDLGSVTVAGSTTTAGFGSLDSKVNERSLDNFSQFDISTNLNLGKFFPEKSRVRIPVYFNYSESISNPEYNPLDEDVKLEDALDNAPDQAARDSIERLAQDFSQRKSINFTNVTIDKRSQKPKIYDPGNFSLSYGYSETYSRNVNTEYDVEKTFRGMLSYNYQTRPTNVEPFKNVEFLSANAFSLIRDFNFYYIPSQVSFRTDIYRYYNETQLRNINNPMQQFPLIVKKDFTWNRAFDLKFDLTKSLQFSFSTNTNARIDEPEGAVNRTKFRSEYELWKDSVIQNIRDFGRTTNYNHNINLQYRVPINKLPLLDWTSLNASYSSMYAWTVGPQTRADIELGNRIKNSQTIQLNSNLNFRSLYNKVNYFAQIERKSNLTREQRLRSQPEEDVIRNFNIRRLMPGRDYEIKHKIGDETVEVAVFDNDGNPVTVEVESLDENTIIIVSQDTLLNASAEVTGQVRKKESIPVIITENIIKIILGVKTVSLNYSENNGTALAGYLPETGFLGQTYSGNTAPGFGFIVGLQDRDFAWKAAENSWYSRDSLLNEPYAMTHNETFRANAVIEPIKNLRINLNGIRSYSRNLSEYYIYNEDINDFNRSNTIHNGNYSMSIISIGTAFKKFKTSGQYDSEVYNEFISNRFEVSRRLASERISNPDIGYDPGQIDTTGFFTGYGPGSQQVLIPAFLAAYTNKSVRDVSLNPFLPLSALRPGWRVTYGGFTNIGFIEKFIKTLNLNHGYQSTFNISSYNTDLRYNETADGYSYIREFSDTSGNFVPQYEINSVSISENLNPLIGVDMTWQNNLTSRMQLNKTRNLSLNITSNQLIEVYSDELVVGMGYRFDDFRLIIGNGEDQTDIQNDLNLRADLSVRKNRTLIRKISEDVNQLTAGQKIFTLSLSADYVLNSRFNLRFYFDKRLNTPYISLSYPTSNTDFGFSLRFSLTQ